MGNVEKAKEVGSSSVDAIMLATVSGLDRDIVAVIVRGGSRWRWGG